MCARNKQIKLNKSEAVYRVVILGVCSGEGWWGGIGKQLRPFVSKNPQNAKSAAHGSSERDAPALTAPTSDSSTITPAALNFTTCTNPRTACNCALSTTARFSKLLLPPVAVRRRLRQLQPCLVSAPNFVRTRACLSLTYAAALSDDESSGEEVVPAQKKGKPSKKSTKEVDQVDEDDEDGGEPDE
jgi:hypothetical protein